METNLIKLEQEPIINSKGLEGTGQLIKKRIKAANIDNIVATEDSLKSMKQLRADFNKEFKDYEEARKVLKKKCMQPYLDFEEQYKLHISANYGEATGKLGDKINSVERDLLGKRTSELQTFFIEQCKANDVDFITFDQTGINVTRSASLKSLKDHLVSFVEKVANDVRVVDALSNSEDYRTDVLVEYQKTLNLEKSLDDIKSRYEAKKAVAKKPMEVPKPEQKPEVKEEAKQDTPLQAPTIEDIFTARFEVKGTRDQIIALNNYLKENNLFYKNI